MPVRNRKFVPKGRARSLGNLARDLESLSKSRDVSRTRKKTTTRKRPSARRDTTTTRKRTIKRRTVRSAVGPWTLRDPAWFGEPRRHAKAAKKGIRKSKARKAAARRPAVRRGTTVRTRTTKRDPAWFGEPRRHAAAARKGAKKRKTTTRKRTMCPCPVRRTTKRTTTKRSTSRRDPAWFGQSERHSYAAEKGWRRVAKPGWRPARVRPRDPAYGGTSPRGRDASYDRDHMPRRSSTGRFVKSRAKAKRPTQTRRSSVTRRRY